MVVGEFRQILVDVEDNGYRDNQHDGVDVCADELLDDIPVHTLQIAEGIQLLQRSQAVPRQSPQPLKEWLQHDDQS